MWLIIEESLYKDSIVLLEGAIDEIKLKLDLIRKNKIIKNERDPISYITSRIKTEESMKQKLMRKNIPINLDNALNKVYDAAGIRIICSYVDDVFEMANILKQYDDMEVIKEKDYIKNPKSNGYRSYHLILKVPVNIERNVKKVYVEVQIRTIAMDFWASLEHEMKYKKNIKSQEMIVNELKRCADESATMDIDMMSIRKMIDEYDWKFYRRNCYEKNKIR